jgi:hypothetical protein
MFSANVAKKEERDNVRREKEREGKTERKTLLFTIKLQNNIFFKCFI